MKKIGIITIHTDFNYGAVLQAYATEKFLELNNYSAEIINYENSHIKKQSQLAYKQGDKYIGYIITFIRNTIFGRYFYYKKAIKNLNLWVKKSEKKYNNITDLNKSNYDILVAGSDQIWNPEISHGFDPAFFLQFGTPKKRISISSSIGSYVLNETDKNFIKKALTTFTHISVREKFAKKQLESLTNKNIKILMDPTFLLTKQLWWDNLAVYSKYANCKSNYILTYFVSGNKSKYRPAIAQYSKKMNLPIWTIQYSNYHWKESDKKILGASIADFIALFANASLIITDSFHGVAFSLNMEKDFVALTNTENPVRVSDLLEMLNLKNRINMQTNNFLSVDYSIVTPQIEVLRKEAVTWIIEAIEN